MSKLVRAAVVAVLMSISALASPGKAQAGQKPNCDIFDVEFYSGNDATHKEQVLVLHCTNDPTSYRAYYGLASENAENCSTVSIDQVKAYANLLTVAKLASKQVTVNWTANTCGQTTIDAVLLTP